MGFSSLYGQNQVKQRLGASIIGESGHAFLFLGPKGIGKKTFARAFAKALLCQNPTTDGACGTCPCCHYFDEHTHPDYRELLIPKGERGIKVAEVRSRILGDVAIMAQIASRKVYLIDGDGLGEEGQNALLKTIEEPPKHVVFLVVVSDKSKLLPTVLSRMVPILFTPNTDDEVISCLREMDELDEKTARLAGRFSNGIIGYAKDIALSGWLIEAWEKMNELVLSLPTVSRTTLLTETFEYFDHEKEDFGELLTLLQMILGDMAVLCEDSSSDSLRDMDKKDRINRMLAASAITISDIHAASQDIMIASKAWKMNGSFECTVCQMLLSLKKEFSHG